MFEVLDGLVFRLYEKDSIEDRLEIAIQCANEFLKILFSKNEIGERWTKSLLTGDDLLDQVIPVSSFPNQRVESWFEKHPYLSGERAAFFLFRSPDAPFECKFYWLNKSSSKSRVTAGVMLTPNWEDSSLTKFPTYRVGIDFFLTAQARSLLVVISNEGKLRVLELERTLTNTQIEIIKNIQGILGHSINESSEPQAHIHKTLWDAFALKQVNKRFYEGISEHFHILSQYIEKKLCKSEKDSKLFANRLIGRLLFIWFLRKKGFINESMDYFSTAEKSSSQYYEEKLKPLFFETLNKPIELRNKVCGKKDLSTPFLNGGLFDPHPNDWIDEPIDFPNDWFNSLFAHFKEFNFTTDESTPEYEQIAIDPEMLGRVFENLLASQLDESGKEARKASGAFYTPREIVTFMCKESIRQYLYQKTEEPTLRLGIDRLLDASDTDYELNHSNTKKYLWGINRGTDIVQQLKQALDDIRILDPACGSGAFPMGMLQVLIKIYERLGFLTNSYDLKLRVLQHSIYGVDIQPMAVEISRLRAWLSIIVDESDPKKVRALPNLDFRFVCANTLVPLDSNRYDKKGQGTFLDDFDEEAYQRLSEIMDKGYYTATTPDIKKRLKDEYYDALKKISPSVNPSKRVQQMLQWDPFDLNKSSPFFDTKTMFNISEGFDVVIGNPPYIHFEKIKDKSKLIYQPLNYVTYEKRGDMYSLFYEKGFKLLKSNGILCFITSNKWMRAAYGQSLRDFLLDSTTPLLLIDFAGVKVFDSATVDVNIFLGKNFKGNVTNPVSAVSISNKNGFKNLSDYIKQKASNCHFSVGESWAIATDTENRIKQKIEQKGTPLKDWNIDINYGIKTGYNDAFIVNGIKRQEILNNCSTEVEYRSTAEIIRPILRGKDIKKYGHAWADLWLINTHNGLKDKLPPVDIKKLPALQKHLDQYIEKISKRADKGDTVYNLRNCAYLEDFFKPKIIFQEIVQKSQFCLDTENYFCNDTGRIITGKHLGFLVGILNSDLFFFAIKHFYGGAGLGGNGVRMKHTFFENFPCIPYDPKIEEMALKLQGAYDEELDKELNRYINDAYHLSENESKYISQDVHNENE